MRASLADHFRSLAKEAQGSSYVLVVEEGTVDKKRKPCVAVRTSR